jgi:DNA polymerase III subunit alpha
MAFVKLEDKLGEGEVIVFPNLYEQVGAKLIQDAVVRVSGKISARDKDGNTGTEAKMIADEIQIVSDKELNEYQSTGKTMDKPKVNSKVRAQRIAAANNNTKSAPVRASEPVTFTPEAIKKIYVHVKNPNDQQSLLLLKQACNKYPGISDVILVLGDDKKSAIKMPFRFDLASAGVEQIQEIFGTDCVAIK